MSRSCEPPFPLQNILSNAGFIQGLWDFWFVNYNYPKQIKTEFNKVISLHIIILHINYLEMIKYCPNVWNYCPKLTLKLNFFLLNIVYLVVINDDILDQFDQNI